MRVVLMKTEQMCSIAFKDRHTQEVALPAGSSVVVPYTIVPLAVGQLPLEVMVLGRDLTGSDRIQKFLRVVVSSSPSGGEMTRRHLEISASVAGM